MTTTVPFGRTGVETSPLALGTSGWGPRRTGETAEQRDARISELADAFFAGRLGTTLLDTSNAYGEDAGAPHSERLIGEAIARVGGVPAGLVVQSKLDRDMATGRFDAARMRDSLAESLDRLGIERIPVLYLHDPENIGFKAAMAPGGPVDALLAMRESGAADAIGISGGPVGMLQRFVETDLFDALVTHNRFTLVDRSAEALLDAAAERGLGIANAAPYGAGVLTGDPRFAGSYGYRPIRPEVQDAVDRATAACVRVGVPLSAAALQFSLRDPRVHTTIVGAASLAGWERAARDAAARIPDELWAELAPLAAGIALDAW